MRSKFLSLFLFLFLPILIGCSKQSDNSETTPQLELVQTSLPEAIEYAEAEIDEETEFPIAQEIYVYEPRGRRDPFLPLLVAEGDRQPGEERKISVENLSLVGIMWGYARRIAILSDQAGNGYVFKEGDSLPGGKVVSVGDRSIIFQLSQFGIVTKYEIVMEE